MYFDHNATSPLRDSAKKAILDHMDLDGNASSVHRFGRDVRQVIEKSRKSIIHALGITESKVIFTSGATEANNLAVQGFPGCVIASAIEHDSVLKSRPNLVVCPVDMHGMIDLVALQKLINKHQQSSPLLVSVMAANNETGIVQPMSEVIAIVKQAKAFIHCDATQVLGRIDMPWNEFDMVSFSGHKIGAPSGIGCLIVKSSCPLQALMKGGGQEYSYRAGTENMLGIVAFSASLEDCFNDDWGSVRVLRDYFESSIESEYSNLQIIGKNLERLPNTSLLVMPGIKSETQVINFDLKGIAVSAGSACSSGKVKNSHVLEAMGLDAEISASSLRISMGPYNTLTQVDKLVSYWLEMARSKIVNKKFNSNLSADYVAQYA